MSINIFKAATLIGAVGLVFFVITCVSDLAVGGPGSGSETTNGFMAAVRYQDGTPAMAATVKIRPSDYLRDTSMGSGPDAALAIIDTVTDSLGRFSFRGIEPFDYVIEVIDSQGNEGALYRGNARQDSVVDCGVLYLNPVGQIVGTVDYSGIPDTAAVYLQMYGLDRIERVDVSTGSYMVGGVVSGDYDLRLFTTLPSFLPKIIKDVKVVPSVATMVDTVALTPLSNWCCSRRVYLNTTASGAAVTVTLKRFPVFIRLTSENFDFISAQTSGGDIRFLKPDNTPLAYHIERWDAANSRAELWVSIDSVQGNNDTQYFVMLWGNPDAVSEASSASVFDTAMGFEGVWHMNEPDSAATADATGNHYDGRKYGPTSAAVQGMCGLAQRFDGASQYIVLSNTASSALNFAENGYYSISAWVYAEALDNDFHSIVSKGNQQYGLQLAWNIWQFFEFHHRIGWESVESSATAKSWKYVTGVRAGKRQYLYVDGEIVDSTISTTEGVANRNTGDNVFIGRRTLDTTRYWNGMIDEVRTCSWAHSINWIKLCYMNQKQEDELVEFR
jgi:hypothetical protein